MNYLCKHCGDTTSGKSVKPGSGWIELILWLTYIFPGVLYSIWRISNTRLVCNICGAGNLIPENFAKGNVNE